MAKNRKRAAPPNDAPVQQQHKNKKIKTTPTIADVVKGPFVESPDRAERKREADLYDLLSSIDEDDRKHAAQYLISGLLGDPEKPDDTGSPEPVLERHLFKRLLRGLASGRKAARVGFSLLLTEILRQLFGEQNLAETKYPALTFERLWKGFMDATQATGEMSGQEERDHTFGRLFGMYAFVRSTALFHKPSRWEPALDVLLKLGKKKAWMRSQCGFTIMEALRQMNEKQVQATLRRIAEQGQAKTPEGVAVWLAASSQHPNLKVPPWGNPLATKSLDTLAAVLKESYQLATDDSGEDASASKQAGWTKDPHFVWDLIQRYYSLDELASVADFSRFWNTVVDGEHAFALH
jgi:DNA polymerase phi